MYNSELNSLFLILNTVRCEWGDSCTGVSDGNSHSQLLTLPYLPTNEVQIFCNLSEKLGGYLVIMHRFM